MQGQNKLYVIFTSSSTKRLDQILIQNYEKVSLVRAQYESVQYDHSHGLTENNCTELMHTDTPAQELQVKIRIFICSPWPSSGNDRDGKSTKRERQKMTSYALF
jgi:hypothetical protein